ncbi:hypothetical protein OOK58_02330 [Streptomyces sp. NBC_01728]|uniref:hypothetical protein n=1 Tax=unclassified Streptomyces TaxID=2593676 RepID=UPI002252B511|nr:MULTISPECIES: hypothetical protein [unclassified Streptomyces]MCX4461521.1 hypothetical protein [Streptomyces sp. NBC_01719]MCX4490428.1 hypothetical protein [Streptomyces sp. NBC_01728]MCX4597233.1 hypothetical protein [Streptomyces sp. NBC_01549]
MRDTPARRATAATLILAFSRRSRARASWTRSTAASVLRRPFLYENPEARAAVTTAMAETGERRTGILADQDNEHEATCRERALNAEDSLKTAHAEILAPSGLASANSSSRAGTCRPSGPKRPSSG